MTRTVSNFARAMVINCFLVISSWETFKVKCQTLPTGDSVQCTVQRDGTKGFFMKWNDINVRCTVHTCPGYTGCEKCCDSLKSKEQFKSERWLITDYPPLTKGKAFLLSMSFLFSFHQ